MKRAVWVSAMGVMGLAATGMAHAQEVGRVISSTPVVQQVPVQRQVCAQQPVAMQPQQQGGGAGAILGAIVGGVIGNQIGHGMGRAAATGVGMVAGAAIGDHASRGEAYAAQPVAQCSTQTTYENRTVGYNVQYEYAGKTYNVQMPHDPGATIPLQIQPMTSQSSQLAPADGVQSAFAPQQPVQPVYVQPAPTVVYPGYAHPYGYPAYYAPRPYWVAPVSFSLGYVHHGGHRHWRR